MRFTKTIASASVAAVLGLAGVSVAGAASTSGAPEPSTASTAPSVDKAATTKPAHAAELRRRIRRHAGTLVAKTIGITRADLRTELLAGKTIAAIATEHGVQPQKVIDTLVAAANKKVDTALTNGKITAERAAKLKARIATAVPKLVNEWHPKAKAPAQG
jgi:ribosomal protein S20